MHFPLSRLFAVAAFLVVTRVAAHGSGGAQLPNDPAAVTDEGARAKAMAAEVRAAAPHLPGEAPPADVAASLQRTQRALQRASGAHAAGDARTARLLGKVALGWAEAAKAQLAATRAEKASGDVEKAAADLVARRDRGRALITESQARKGQLAAQIERKKHDVEAAKAPKPDKKPDKKGDAKKPSQKKPTGDKLPASDKNAPKKGAQP